MHSSIEFKTAKFLNVGCGQHYLNRADWLNLDLNSASEKIKDYSLSYLINSGCSGQFHGIYCSHLIEHFERQELVSFLGQCYDLLAAKGGIRIVTPDFDSIVECYIRERDAGNFQRSEFEKVLLLEQCVRLEASGFYRESIATLSESDLGLQQYVHERTGSTQKSPSSTEKKEKNLIARLRRARLRLEKKIRRKYMFLLKTCVPSSLKSNIATTDAGERHHWVYSFFELGKIAEASGYHLALRKSGETTEIFDQSDILALDTTHKGSPRKGSHSMYVELIKS